jgi:hypothetical protein
METKIVWPDAARIKMLQKSDFYEPDKQIYEFAFFDGFQKCVEMVQLNELFIDNKTTALINKYEKLIAQIKSFKKSGLIEREDFSMQDAIIQVYESVIKDLIDNPNNSNCQNQITATVTVSDFVKKGGKLEVGRLISNKNGDMNWGEFTKMADYGTALYTTEFTNFPIATKDCYVRILANPIYI